MPKSRNKKTLSFCIPLCLADRIEEESKQYGVTKTFIIQSALLNYYQQKDFLLHSYLKSQKDPPGGAAT